MLICMHNWGSSLHLLPHRRSSIIVIARMHSRVAAHLRFRLFMLFMQLARSTLVYP